MAKNVSYSYSVSRTEHGRYTHLIIQTWKGKPGICNPHLWHFDWQGSKEFKDWYGLQISTDFGFGFSGGEAAKFLQKFAKRFSSTPQPQDLIAWLLGEMGGVEVRYHSGLHDYLSRQDWPEQPIYAAVVYSEEGRREVVGCTPAGSPFEANRLCRKKAVEAIEQGSSLQRYWVRWLSERRIEYTADAESWKETDLVAPGAATEEVVQG